LLKGSKKYLGRNLKLLIQFHHPKKYHHPHFGIPKFEKSFAETAKGNLRIFGW